EGAAGEDARYGMVEGSEQARDVGCGAELAGPRVVVRRDDGLHERLEGRALLTREEAATSQRPGALRAGPGYREARRREAERAQGRTPPDAHGDACRLVNRDKRRCGADR